MQVGGLSYRSCSPSCTKYNNYSSLNTNHNELSTNGSMCCTCIVCLTFTNAREVVYCNRASNITQRGGPRKDQNVLGQYLPRSPYLLGTYSTEVIERYTTGKCMPFAPFIRKYFCLVNDNAPTHIAIVTACEFVIDVKVQELCLRSGDLNPIEHFWDRFKRTSRRSASTPLTIHELECPATAVWDNIHSGI